MRATIVSTLATAALILAGCETNTPNSAANNTELQQRAQSTVQQMMNQDPDIKDVIKNAYGYAVFPEVGTAAVGVGGSSGQGVVYRNGQLDGAAKIDAFSLGPQLGGQTYSELIIFLNQKALNRLENDSLEFGGEASATLVKAGAATAARFDNGVGVFVLPKGGLMAGASVSGQKFHFYPNGAGSGM